MYDDDAKAPWTSEMPTLRPPLVVDPNPGEMETRFRRTVHPTYHLESTWLPTTIGSVQGFREAAIGRSDEPGAPAGSAYAIFTWVKVSD
jgi:hypothetical protein